MRYNYKIVYSDKTIESNAYSLKEADVYKAVNEARSDYIKRHKGVSVVKITIVSVT